MACDATWDQPTIDKYLPLFQSPRAIQQTLKMDFTAAEHLVFADHVIYLLALLYVEMYFSQVTSSQWWVQLQVQKSTLLM